MHVAAVHSRRLVDRRQRIAVVPHVVLPLRLLVHVLRRLRSQRLDALRAASQMAGIALKITRIRFPIKVAVC